MIGDAASWSTGSLEEAQICFFFISQKLSSGKHLLNEVVSAVQFLLLRYCFYLVYFYFHINYYQLMYFFIMNILFCVSCGYFNLMYNFVVNH